VIFDERDPVRTIRTHRWKYVHRYLNGSNELHDLVNDERRNLINGSSQKSV